MDNKYVNKALELSSKVASNVYLDAISKGLMGTLPILIIGSIGCLLGVFPFDPYLQFIEKIGVKTYFLTASTVTTSCLSIYAAFLIGYRLAGSFKCDQIPAGLISVFAFFITTPLTKDSGLMMEFMGAKGLFGAMIAALIATRIYCAFMNVDKLKIKMPDGVPPMIANTFTALIPAILVGLIFIVVATIFSFTPYGSFTQLVYTVIVTPLNSLGGSVWSLVVLILVQMLLWFFGIHGSMTVLPILFPIWLSYIGDNTAAMAAGKAIPHVLNIGLWDLANLGGSGATIGLVILMFFKAKSEQYKSFGKLTLPCGIFSVNEPVIFGLPVILNPIMLIPFILCPIVLVCFGYALIQFGIVTAPIGILGLGSMPPLISGIMQGSLSWGIFQLVAVVISIIIYYPFFKTLDNQALMNEKGDQHE